MAFRGINVFELKTGEGEKIILSGRFFKAVLNGKVIVSLRYFGSNRI